MRRAKAFSTVNWRKYLDVKTNPRAIDFLKSRGDDVLWQISSEINRAMMTPGTSEVVFLIHPNAGAVIRIPRDEYDIFFEMALSWFEKRENYEMCGTIKSFRENYALYKRGKTIPKRNKEKVI